MKNISISISGIELDFETAQDMTEAIAKKLNPETELMAWFDKKQNKQSPSAVECSAGWERYGETHGAQWEITVNNGEYAFMYT